MLLGAEKSLAWLIVPPPPPSKYRCSSFHGGAGKDKDFLMGLYMKRVLDKSREVCHNYHKESVWADQELSARAQMSTLFTSNGGVRHPLPPGSSWSSHADLSSLNKVPVPMLDSDILDYAVPRRQLTSRGQNHTHPYRMSLADMAPSW